MKPSRTPAATLCTSEGPGHSTRRLHGVVDTLPQGVGGGGSEAKTKCVYPTVGHIRRPQLGTDIAGGAAAVRTLVALILLIPFGAVTGLPVTWGVSVAEYPLFMAS